MAAYCEWLEQQKQSIQTVPPLNGYLPPDQQKVG